MKMSKMFYASQKNISEGQESQSYQFMIKAGLIRKMASGEYAFSPMGFKILESIETIVKEEVERKDMEQILIPTLLPSENENENRYCVKDKMGKRQMLNEESLAINIELVKAEIKSYKKLPVKLYHIQNEYREEEKIRYGLVRSKEMRVQEGYCFDLNEAAAQESYEELKQVYRNILTRCKVSYQEVEDEEKTLTEYYLPSGNSDHQWIRCKQCNYQSKTEKATGNPPQGKKEEKIAIEKIHTPNVGTIEDLVNHYQIPEEKMVKTILYKADGNVVIAMVKSDRDINEEKLKKLLGAENLELADEDTVYEVTGAVTGFAGPIGLKKEVPIYVDEEVMQSNDFLVGANESDYHLIHVAPEDFTYTKIADIRIAKQNDYCPKCETGILQIQKGIKLGKVERLGTKYAKQKEASFTDETGSEAYFEITQAKLGITRLMGAIAEENKDEKGIIWPKQIAPFFVDLVVIANDNEIQMALANTIYQNLTAKGIKVLFDDRKERPGTKFADSEILGIPYRITVGRDAAEGMIELCERETGQIANEKAEKIDEKIK